MIEETGVVIAFWVLAGVTLGAALAVAAVRNLIHSVLFLILSFAGVAGLYITLSADFIAVVQVIVYIGAVAVLIIFAVMLTPLSGRNNSESLLRWPALALAVAVAAGVTFVALSTTWSDVAGFAPVETASAIGEALLGPFVLPFEVASVLLVAAMIGAILLVQED